MRRDLVTASSIVFGLFLALTSSGCAKLTEPSKDEPIQVDPSQAANANEAKPSEMKLNPPASAEKPHLLHDALAVDAGPPSTVSIKDIVVGKGPEAKAGDSVTVHYVGTLPDGTEFDASKKHGKPFDFPLGQHAVITGWDQGVAGMKVGGKRKLVIPPELAYGPRGRPGIPPNSTLTFEIEMLGIKAK